MYHTPHAEVEEPGNPIPADSERYRITRIEHDADLQTGESTLILHLLHRESGQRRVLLFSGARCDHPLKRCIAIYLMDIRHRSWEGLGVEVGDFYDERGACFRAREVRDITTETSAA